MRNTTAKALRLAIFAGEASGDLQGAHLVEALRARCGALEAWGIGGPALARAGVKLEFDRDRTRTMCGPCGAAYVRDHRSVRPIEAVPS